MNEKELRKISRKELLELLLEQANRIVDLEKELADAMEAYDDEEFERSFNTFRDFYSVEGIYIAQGAIEDLVTHYEKQLFGINKEERDNHEATLLNKISNLESLVSQLGDLYEILSTLTDEEFEKQYEEIKNDYTQYGIQLFEEEE